MNQKERIETLQGDVIIPEVVQNKMNETLKGIQDRGQQGSKIVRFGDQAVQPVVKRSKRRFGMIAAIAALVITTVSVGAAVYMNWSKGLEANLHVEEAQKPKLEENKTTTFMEQVATDQGITVTAKQSISDNYYTYIAFKVEGLDIAEGEQPGFEHTNVTVDGVIDGETKAIGRFYDGLTTGPDGTIVKMDGSPATDENDILVEQYQQADGSMEYHLTVYQLGQKGHLLNKKIHIELENLGTLGKAEYVNKVTGKWAFDIDLQGSNEVREATINVPLGDTGATVIGAEISPISIGATYNFPRNTETMELPEEEAIAQALAAGIEVEDIETIVEVPIDPPTLCGVKMKDGTLYPYLYMGPGMSGYLDENSDTCYIKFAINRILDANQVEALLFQKTPAGEGEIPTEDNFYVVPLQ